MDNNENRKLTFLDLISIMSFCIGLENLDMNITQENMDEQTAELDKRLRSMIKDIHDHLSVQDTKLNIALEKLNTISGKIGGSNDSRRNF